MKFLFYSGSLAQISRAIVDLAELPRVCLQENISSEITKRCWIECLLTKQRWLEPPKIQLWPHEKYLVLMHITNMIVSRVSWPPVHILLGLGWVFCFVLFFVKRHCIKSPAWSSVSVNVHVLPLLLYIAYSTMLFHLRNNICKRHWPNMKTTLFLALHHIQTFLCTWKLFWNKNTEMLCFHLKQCQQGLCLNFSLEYCNNTKNKEQSAMLSLYFIH